MAQEEKVKKSFELLKKDISSLKEEIQKLSRSLKDQVQPKKIAIDKNEELFKFYTGKKILITGGLGFIGSNLAKKILEFHPGEVILVDSLIKGLGGNKINIREIEDKVKVYSGEKWDLRNVDAIAPLLKDVDYVFNLAGSVSHIGSKENPSMDLELNLRSHLHFLEACRKAMKDRKKPIKIVYAGTRDQYGKVKEKFLPVKEDYLIDEVTDPQGINKHSAEFYHFWYKNFGIRAVSLRLTNVYGPKHIMTDHGQGVVNWFIRKAIDDEVLDLWGGGEALRDFLYVDDVVEAFLLVMALDKTDGQSYNLGAYRKKNGLYEIVGDNVKSIQEMAKIIIEVGGSGSLNIIPYPEDRKPLEPGHFYADATKIFEEVGWEAKTDIREGLRKTISFYRKNKSDYW